MYYYSMEARRVGFHTLTATGKWRTPMKIVDLIRIWDSEVAGEIAPEAYQVHLPLDSVAKIEALAEMFPHRTRERLISELLSVALDEVVSCFPYIEGDVVITNDEEGNPIFEDIGHTPRYLNLVRKHVERLKNGGA